MSAKRVTGSLVVVKRQTGPVSFLKARDRDGRQIKRKLGPVSDWPRKKGTGRPTGLPDRLGACP
jgi:hypothetical protein